MQAGISYRSTRQACYLGYITQAIINNLPPLLFITFSSRFSLALGQLTVLVSLNFAVQLLVDLAAANFADRIGYRRLITSAHFLAVLGLACMGVLPFVLPAYPALILATVINAMGGGLLEVIVSPIIEALPAQGGSKAASMSLLHSFYCWGCVGVILVSTLFLHFFGSNMWFMLPLLWAALPLLNGIWFTRVPIRALNEGRQHENLPLGNLLCRRVFLLLFLLMVCAGASEQAMSQWASFFAEAGLGISKTLGDILGPCMFALFMGLGRLFFGLKSREIFMERALVLCAGLCVGAYLLASLSPWPLVSLLGCSLCGLSVAVMWPGTFTLAAKYFPQGGTAMFAILALAGDLGCSAGPGLVGVVSGIAAAREGGLAGGQNTTGAALKTGLLFACVFPALLAAAVYVLQRAAKRERARSNSSMPVE